VTFGEVVNWIALALALFLLVSSFVFIRPANGERPLLVGFMLSAMFGVYFASVRLLEAQGSVRAVTGVVLTLWLAGKLWALYATVLHTPRPLTYSLRRLALLVFGHNPKPPTE
jgi:hypothetical protein